VHFLARERAKFGRVVRELRCDGLSSTRFAKAGVKAGVHDTGAAVPPLSSDQERWHHAFAHYVLRVATFQDPDFTFGALSAPDSAQRLVLAAMALLGRHYKLSVEQIMALARSIHSASASLQSRRWLSHRDADATTGRRMFLPAVVRKGDGAIDYVTLERTDDDGVMLCGWNAEGGHLTYGEKSTRDLDGFIAEVVALRLGPPGA